MNLLPIELESKIPKLGGTFEVVTDEKIAVAKYFSSVLGWEWYAVEGGWEDEDFTFFGFVTGSQNEWGFFSLMEIDNINVERDTVFTPKKIGEIFAQ